ncbi:sigma-54 dependent transcriptional regulator [Desulfothermus okinawensis JCM 13304]
MEPLILIIDDEEDIRISLTGILEDEGYRCIGFECGEKAIEFIKSKVEPDAIFLDIWLTGMDGVEVLKVLKKDMGHIPVIMISGHGNIETAVQTIKLGAFDFIEKPLSLEKVVVTAKKALEFKELTVENQRLKYRVKKDIVEELTGKSKAILKVKEQIEKVAPTDAWVLITGSNGTGKEIVARAIHKKSKRANRPLIAINCAAIPEELIESELFGHEKGSFTGAHKSHMGKFELAHMGTLFLDEIGDMSLKTQAKILRILQEQKFERVGGNKTIEVDVRVIVATNKDLKKEIEEGRFREDLYYRLNVFPIHVPDLKDRKEDIPILIEEFIDSFCKENGYQPIKFTKSALARLTNYPWPGNVRELKNFTERMLILYAGRKVDVSDLPEDYKNSASPTNNCSKTGFMDMDFKTAKSEFEKQYLASKLKEANGNISRLSELIGLERSYLHKKLKSYGILASSS